jgi:MEDS: MEthanogen/methylotroph, DcmR Sensory domain
MSQRIEKLGIGNHIIAIYNTGKEKFNEAFEFLTEGLTRNEVAMLITEELTTREVIDILKKNFNIQNIEELVDRGDFIVKSTSEWYFPDGVPSIQRTKAMWAELINIITKRGKAGLRVVGDVSAFFKYGLHKQLIQYETSLEQKFDFPLTAICAYDRTDMSKYLSAEEIKSIEDHHHPVWK